MSIFTTNQQSNVFVTTLNLLHVKHTKSFSNKFFNEHPFKNDFLGLTKMFSEYGIECKKQKINHIQELSDIQTPFIACLDDQLVVISRVAASEIQCILNDKMITLIPQEFLERSRNDILIPLAKKESIEPDYYQNRKYEFFNLGLRYFFLCALIMLCSYFYIKQGLFTNTGLTLLLIVNLAGIYTSYLLVLVQLHIQNKHVDKICSLIKQNSCSSILESKSAKFLNLISWSTIGLSYFIGNTLLILFFPDSIVLLAIINVLGLPYTFWSIWYQKVKAKNWCSLCLIVQKLIWFIFITNVWFGFINIGELSFKNIIPEVCIYIIPFISAYFLIPKLGEAQKMEQIIQEINKLKATEEVFWSFLKQQPYYKVDKETSNILWGNKDSKKLITVIINPHCDHCGEIHKSINKLLQNTENQFCAQYIFTAFGELFNSSSKFLIASYFNQDKDAVSEIYHNWFETGKYKWDNFIEKYDFDLESIDVNSEFNSHLSWLNSNKLNVSPVILINGFELPKSYKVDDLIYFSTCDLKIK